MKQSPDLAKAQENMKPGVITLRGFIGKDPRNLIDILIDDDARVQRLGLSHQQIARRMEELRDQGKRGLGEFIEVPPHFLVRVESVRGKLPSPFGGKGLFEKRNTTVKNLPSSKVLIYTDLNIHLIREHGFYEGKGSDFRLEPGDLASILEISPQGDA